MNEDWIRAQTTDLVNLKAAAWAMDADALLLSQQGDATGALNECLDLLRFGQAISRHGLLINFLVGSACEVIAVRRMTNLCTTLNVADCRRAALALQEHESRRESINDITRRDKQWSRRTYGMFARIRAMIDEGSLNPKGLGLLFVNPAKEHQTRAREVRLCMLQLAARAFELERGRKLRNASELVPEFLRAVPLDPVSQTPLERP